MTNIKIYADCAYCAWGGSFSITCPESTHRLFDSLLQAHLQQAHGIEA